MEGHQRDETDQLATFAQRHDQLRADALRHHEFALFHRLGRQAVGQRRHARRLPGAQQAQQPARVGVQRATRQRRMAGSGHRTDHLHAAAVVRQRHIGAAVEAEEIEQPPHGLLDGRLDTVGDDVGELRRQVGQQPLEGDPLERRGIARRRGDACRLRAHPADPGVLATIAASCHAGARDLRVIARALRSSDRALPSTGTAGISRHPGSRCPPHAGSR